MDEAVITISGSKFRLWRAIDADGDVFDILVKARRNAKAAKRFFSGLVKQLGEPHVVETHRLRSYIKPIQTLSRLLPTRQVRCLPPLVRSDYRNECLKKHQSQKPGNT